MNAPRYIIFKVDKDIRTLTAPFLSADHDFKPLNVKFLLNNHIL